MDNRTSLDRAALLQPFQTRLDRTEQIGIEVELGTVSPTSGRSLPYSGENGVHALLRAILEKLGGQPKFEGENLIGIKLDGGAEISLESGGALEYASLPEESLGSVVEKSNSQLRELAEIARSRNAALVSGAMLPFNTRDEVTWIPKRRISLMLDYFHRRVGPGSSAWAVMANTLSTQATLDYLSEADMSSKLRMQTATTPVIAAIFVNSPIEGGRPTGALSRRLQLWTAADPSRIGIFPYSLRETIRFEEFVDWALSLPLVFRTIDGRPERAPDQPFCDLLESGFPDGTMPTADDWLNHLSTLWPHVRLRRTLELRVADGPPFHAMAAVPALWTGLTYHGPSRDAAWGLVRERTLVEHVAALDEVTVSGLQARFGPDSVQELARELVRLAADGLQARVRAGLEPAHVQTYLTAIEEVVSSGETFGERLVTSWHHHLRGSPERYVEAFRL